VFFFSTAAHDCLIFNIASIRSPNKEITFIVKHIVIPTSLIVRGRARVVAWPDEPEPLLSNGPRHIAGKLMSL
jgi:hypothetical protein